MSTSSLSCLVTAKAPVPGRVKTRLAATVGAEAAARIAAASLLDTLAACAVAVGARQCHLALDGDLDAAVGGDEVRRALSGWTVFGQEGHGLAERLAHAHRRTRDLRVVQVGMDTPQVTPADLASVAAQLDAHDVVLGPATDGGWWALARRAGADVGALSVVPMSTPDTGADTVRALTAAGLTVGRGGSLTDVDTAADAHQVATAAPGTRFAGAWRAAAEHPATGGGRR